MSEGQVEGTGVSSVEAESAIARCDIEAVAGNPPGQANGEVTSHTCRDPAFNAMTDTCPACPRKSAESVRAEADENPFRHVRASRWIVQSLLQHHYLPYWPKAASDVFATIDIRKGLVVGACVFGTSVLRCRLREDVFGLLPPETLNRDFRTLIRWMVHPDYRVNGVGTSLLRWSLSQMKYPVIEAINRSWVPVAAFLSVGMVHRFDDKRHYYYRLSDVRTRDDEATSPPPQAETPLADPATRYPRVWDMTNAAPAGTKIIVVQAYQGAEYRGHMWKDDTYCVWLNAVPKGYEPETGGAFAPVTDPLLYARWMRLLGQGLPLPVSQAQGTAQDN